MKKLWSLLSSYDKILILSLLIISVIFIILPLIKMNNGKDINIGEEQIVIQVSDGSKMKIPLQDTYRENAIIVPVDGPIGTSIIEAHQGRVRMKAAPAADPEKICEKTGWIDQVGPVIICVPNQISIWIEAKESEIDGVSW